MLQAQFRHRRERVPTATVLEVVGMGGEPAPAAGRLLGQLAPNVQYDE